jgi:hypothetical protein
MKTYLPNETKEQRKQRKALQKQGFSHQPVQIIPSTTKNYVVCLKWGTKYGPEYVNKLHKMVERNLTIDHEFVCYTENPQGIDKNIRIEPLPVSNNIVGWWYKPFFFNPNLILRGTLLFLDLDLIIFRNIDNLFTYKPDSFCIIRDFNRYSSKNYQKFNSSVFRLTSGTHTHVYTDFIKDATNISRKFHGDQDWIKHCITTKFDFWPDEWIQSYKWEMRNRPQMARDATGKKNFITPGQPNIHPQTSIAVFHGDPNPDTCIDPWVKQNWR